MYLPIPAVVCPLLLSFHQYLELWEVEGSGREKNLQLCRSVMHVSQNALTGSDQKGPVYWEKVFQHFSEEFPGRTMCAIKNRWKSAIQPATNTFCGHYTTISSAPQSGCGEEDIRNAALELYESIQNSPFEHMLCWEYLRDKPKWNDIKRAPLDLEAAEANLTQLKKRPMGVDTMKNIVARDNDKKRKYDELLEATKARNALIAEQNRLFLFSIKDADIPDESRDFFAQQRALAMKEIENEMKLNDM
ncbi:unnamed protein product [Aphanomyces euteiches]